MLKLIKPDRLHKGDKVATVSLSWAERETKTCSGVIMWASKGLLSSSVLRLWKWKTP
jgi:hypothetical protein